MSGFVVVDASVAVKWLVREEHSTEALALQRMWAAEDITTAAPYLMPFEVANTLHRRVLQGELSVANSARLMTWLLESGLELHQPQGLHVRALELASQLNQGAVYDCHYLALAEEFGCDMWTADRRFHRAVNDRVGLVRRLGEFVLPG